VPLLGRSAAPAQAQAQADITDTRARAPAVRGRKARTATGGRAPTPTPQRSSKGRVWARVELARAGVELRAGILRAGIEARYVLRGGPLSLSLGPQLEVLARPIVVEIAKVEAFHVSNLVAGFVMDAEGDLIR
jgi:hypothetical protein